MQPDIFTSRFLLRRIVDTDIGKVFAGLSHPQIIKYYGISYDSLEATHAQMKFYNKLLEEDTGVWWAVCYKDNPSELVGACGYNDWNKLQRDIEIGYWLLVEHWGKGIMQECLPAIIQYAFQHLNVYRIIAVVEAGNEPSSKLLLKLGFEFERTLKDCEIKNGNYISLQYYFLLNGNHQDIGAEQ